MPLLIMLTPMQKCRMLLAILLVHCCVDDATVDAIAHATYACDDAMLICLQKNLCSPYYLQLIYEIVPDFI